MSNFRKAIYGPIYTIDDIPRPLKSKADWVKINFIQIDSAISETASRLLEMKYYSIPSLREAEYLQFLEEVKDIEKSYKKIREDLLSLSRIVPSSRSKNKYVKVGSPDELKRVYLGDCERLSKSIEQLLSDSENLFKKFNLNKKRGRNHESKRAIEEGIQFLTGEGLESLFD